VLTSFWPNSGIRPMQERPRPSGAAVPRLDSVRVKPAGCSLGSALRRAIAVFRQLSMYYLERQTHRRMNCIESTYRLESSLSLLSSMHYRSFVPMFLILWHVLVIGTRFGARFCNTGIALRTGVSPKSACSP
jgi:hypothetical protein